MGVREFEQGLAIVRDNADQADFVGPRGAELIAHVERALGGRLPPTYRQFVEALGAGNFGAFEVYGAISRDFENSTAPDGAWLTLDERRNGTIPADRIVVGSTGDGAYYCIRQGEEDSPVEILWPGTQHVEAIAASDFGSFFLAGVEAELAP